MKIRDAILEDIPFIVDIHIRSFEGFFLTLMGENFLTELYLSFAFMENGILRVIYDENNGKPVGFAAGTNTPEDFYRELRKQKGFRFFIKSLPGLVKNPILVVKKLWYAVFYKGEKPTGMNRSTLLSSIAILPDLSGQSLGKKLLSDYEERAKDMGSDSLYLTTDRLGNDGVVNFYRRNNYQVESEFIQADGRQMLRFFKKF